MYPKSGHTVVMCSLTYSLKLVDCRKNSTMGRFPVFRPAHLTVCSGLVIVEPIKTCVFRDIIQSFMSYFALYQGTRVFPHSRNVKKYVESLWYSDLEHTRKLGMETKLNRTKSCSGIRISQEAPMSFSGLLIS